MGLAAATGRGLLACRAGREVDEEAAALRGVALGLPADFLRARVGLAERPVVRGDDPFLTVLFFVEVRGAFPRRCFAKLLSSACVPAEN